MHKYPALVHKLCYDHEAWIVGSSANPDDENPKDFDILVPLSNWQQASLLIPSDAIPNTFGGWKCISGGKEVDVWPGDLAWLLTNDMLKWAYHPRTNTGVEKAFEEIIIDKTEISDRKYSPEETVRLGKALYEQKIKSEVESGNMGKQLVIDIETGYYAMSDQHLVAARLVREHNPQAVLFAMRIGYTTIGKVWEYKSHPGV